MDPVSLALISGVLGGAAGGVAGEATAELIKAYKALRGLLIKKYGEDSILLRSIGTLEQRPESKAKQEGVVEEVVDQGADKDEEVRKAAEAVLAQLDQSKDGRVNIHQEISGDNNTVAALGHSGDVHITR